MSATKMPAAEIDLTTELVRQLLEAQFPKLAELPLSVASNGWDNVLFRLGDDLVVRMPRRQAAAQLVENEIRWLPELEQGLPLQVPTPIHAGSPTSFYPWSWSIIPWVNGRAIGTRPFVDEESAARLLGQFLAVLHRPAPEGFPPNPYRGIPLSQGAETTEQRFSVLDTKPDLQQRLRPLWNEALAATPWRGAPIWIHGDLHPANIIITDDKISSVIDFGDVTAGDPATDLLIAWALFGSEARDVFRLAAETKTRPIDDAMWVRGRGWAIRHGLAVLSASADNPEMHAIALRTLEGAASN